MRRVIASRRPLFVLGLAGATAVFLATVPLHRHWFDLGVYYGAVGYWIRDGGQLYDYLVPGTGYGFTYPPFAAICMLPMTLVSWPAAIAISLGLSAAAAAALLYWLVDPVARRQGWSRWFTFAVAGCLLALMEPVRDTLSFGQVNLVLVALVFTDAWLLRTGRGRCAGLGIGLAAAIKLTPAMFIGYLVVARRWRAAGIAAGTAVTATFLGAQVAPGASRVFWTGALWDTDRVGRLAYVSNQSLQGVLARLEPAAPNRVAWAVAVLTVLCIWAYRAHRAAAAGDELAGFALTGLAACLISPITWVHHLVWVIPPLVLLADAGLRAEAGGWRRRRLLTAAGSTYVVLCSSLVWLWWSDASGVDGFLGSNAYVWIGLALLLTLPVRPSGAVSLEKPPHRGTAARARPHERAGSVPGPAADPGEVPGKVSADDAAAALDEARS